MTYEQLDTIADSYIPVLVVVLFSFLILNFKKNKFVNLSVKLLCVFICVLVVYILMFVDICFSIFSSFGLDYSTHTGLSLALVSCLVSFISLTWNKVLFVVSLVLYFLLMLYQQYHSFADIFVTLIVVLPFFYGVLNYRNLKSRTV